MRDVQMRDIASRAAEMAVRQDMAESTIGDYDMYYQEYMDQLRSNDYQCLRQWIGYQIEAGIREASEIMKLLIRAKLRAGAVRR